MNACTLSANDVSVRYGNHIALRGVSCALVAGTAHAIVGESGSGKSTLLRALLRLTPVSAGRVTLNGNDITSTRERDLRDLRRTAQVVFQDPYASLSPTRTIGWLLEESLGVGGTPRHARREGVSALLDRVGLADRMRDALPRRLSGGQRQRVAIARALGVQPKILLCDEVTSALDVASQLEIAELLATLRNDLGLGLAIVTHDLALAGELCSTVQVLRDGVVVEEGTFDQIIAEPGHAYTRELVEAARW